MWLYVLIFPHWLWFESCVRKKTVDYWTSVCRKRSEFKGIMLLHKNNVKKSSLCCVTPTAVHLRSRALSNCDETTWTPSSFSSFKFQKTCRKNCARIFFISLQIAGQTLQIWCNGPASAASSRATSQSLGLQLKTGLLRAACITNK